MASRGKGRGGSSQRPGGVEAKAWWGRGKGLAGSRQRPGGVEAKAGPTAISCRQSLYEISGCVCLQYAVHLETSQNMHSALLLTKYAFKNSNLFQG